MNTERLQSTARNEITRHQQEADRLTSLAHDLLKQADWQLEQAERWCGYLQELGANATEHLAEVIPLQTRPELTVLDGGLA